MVVTKQMMKNLEKHGINCLATVHTNGTVEIHPIDKDSLLKVIEERKLDELKKEPMPVVKVVSDRMSEAEKQKVAEFFVAHQVKGVSKEAIVDNASKFARENGLDRKEVLMKAVDTANEYRKDIAANIVTDMDEAKNPYREVEQEDNFGLDFGM